MYKKLFLTSVLAPLLLTGCPIDEPVETSLSEPETIYVETFSAEGFRREADVVDEAMLAQHQQAHYQYAIAAYKQFSTTERNFISSPFEQQQFINSLA